MLKLAAFVLAAAALGGVCLFAMAQYAKPGGRVWLPGMVHGALGVIGFVLLLVALQGPPRGLATGSSSFGTIGAGLIAAGLCTAAIPVIARARRRRTPAVVLGVHATLAVAGLVMVAAYL